MSNSQQTSHRRWGQFSLRFLLLLTLVVAAYLGGWIANERKHQRTANEETFITVEYLGSNMVVDVVSTDDKEAEDRTRPFDFYYGLSR